jgi:hypothetical protein
MGLFSWLLFQWVNHWHIKKETIEFCMELLYPATLLKVVIRSESLLWNLLGLWSIESCCLCTLPKSFKEALGKWIRILESFKNTVLLIFSLLITEPTCSLVQHRFFVKKIIKMGLNVSNCSFYLVLV